MSKEINFSNIALTIFFIACLATGGIFVKLSGLGPVNTAFYRVLFSLFLLFPFMSREDKRQPVSNKYKWLMFIAGLFLAGDLILWNIAFHYTTVANANLLANLVPFTIVPVSYFLYKEKISKSFAISLFITLIGLVVLIKGKTTTTAGNLYGDTLSFLTSIFYATFLLIVYKIRDKVSAIQIMYYSGFGSIIVLLIGSIVMEGLSYPKNFQEIYPLLGLAIFSQLLGQGGLSYILGKISANLASLLVLTQPVIAAIYSYFIFNEHLSTMEIIGMLIVLSGIFIVKKK